MNRTLWIALFVMGLGWSAACGGGGLTDLEGIYMISAWTENDASCDADGASILDAQTETVFYIKSEDFLGAEFVNVVLCPDLNDCATRAADDETIHIDRFSFEDGSDSSGWTGSGYSLSSGGGQACSGEVLEVALTSPADGQIRIEVQEKDVTDIGLDSDGFCDGDAAEAKAASQPCDRLEVLTGDFVQDI